MGGSTRVLIMHFKVGATIRAALLSLLSQMIGSKGYVSYQVVSATLCVGDIQIGTKCACLGIVLELRFNIRKII